jgi:hypothetical protein
MTVHAFADESRRGSTYLIATAVAHPANLRFIRRGLRSLLLPGQRELHFNDQKDPRRRMLADAIARLPLEVLIYRRCIDRYVEAARQECINRIACDLLARGAHRLVLDSRAQLDTHDAATIRTVFIRQPECEKFVYEHVDSVGESLLWVADAGAWCFGAGGAWRRRINPIVSGVIDLG